MPNFADWLEEARVDLEAAENLGQARIYSRACFHYQQAIEKALKALLIYRGKDFPKIHSLPQLALKAGELTALENLIADLDSDYAASRYADAFGKPTRELYTKSRFEERRKAARAAFERIETWMRG